MTDLVVILISGEELTQNLARSLTEPGAHPWSFGDWKRQMQALKAGTEVAFIELVDEGGRQVNRFTANTAVLAAKRIVLGRVSRGINRTETPFFSGYPFEFRFDEVTDEVLGATLGMDEAAEWLNARVDGLDLESVQLPELVKHAEVQQDRRLHRRRASEGRLLQGGKPADERRGGRSVRRIGATGRRN